MEKVIHPSTFIVFMKIRLILFLIATEGVSDFSGFKANQLFSRSLLKIFSWLRTEE
jgi:hypothetical protein